MGKDLIKVFLDSNVILSGLLSDRGAPRIILDILSLDLPFLIGMTGRYNLIEIERNLKKRLPTLLPLYREYLPKLNLKVIPLPKSQELREFSGTIAAKDVPVFVSAFRGKSDFLVTGDKKHFEKTKIEGSLPLRIVTPSEFLDQIVPEILQRFPSLS